MSRERMSPVMILDLSPNSSRTSKIINPRGKLET